MTPAKFAKNRFCKAAALLLLATAWASLPALGTGCNDNNAAPPPQSPGQTPTSTPTASPSPSPAPTQITVNITQVFFHNTIIVQQDIDFFATIIIVNDDEVVHSIDADDDSFHSGPIRPGQQIRFEVNEPGDHPYHCGVHPNDPNERGILHVEPPSEASPTPSPSASASVTPSPTPSASASVTPSSRPSASPTVAPPVPVPVPLPVPSESASPSATPTPVESPPDTIVITAGASTRTSDAFARGPVSVAQGATVTVTNDDTIAHTATADDQSFNTGPIQPGQSATFLASKAGDIPFHCSIHPNMKGVLHVEGSAQPSPSPTATASPRFTPSPTATPTESPSSMPMVMPSSPPSVGPSGGPGMAEPMPPGM